MKEIGSEFWNIPVCDKQYSFSFKNFKWFLSGRHALRYIIKDIKSKCKINSVWLPSWCCESMIIPFLSEGISVEFYPVYFEKGKLVCEYPNSGDAILVMDYFGYIRSYEFSGFSGIVIRDLTHSMFSSIPDDGDYYFGSLRKWCGFYTGGFAFGRYEWTTDFKICNVSDKYVNLRQTAMNKKAEFIAGNSSDKSYLDDFSFAEEMLDKINISEAFSGDILNFKYLDVGFLKAERRRNADLLIKNLSEYSVFTQVQSDDCPLFVPVLVNNRNNVRKHLIDNKIYCPVHWPISRHHKLNDCTRQIYDTEISLICDQRYSENEMNRIIEVFKTGLNLC